MKDFFQRFFLADGSIDLKSGIDNEWFCCVAGDSDVARLQCAVDERDGLRRDALPPRVHVSHHSTSANMHELGRTGESSTIIIII